MTEPSQRTWVAETHFTGVIAELRLPRASVQQLLPAGFRIDAADDAGRSATMLLLFGAHEQSTVHMAALRVRTGVRFHEVLFGVPCLMAPGEIPVLFVPLMYCDEPVSAWSGNALYGFNKHAASMEWLGQTFVASDGGHVALHAVTHEADHDPPAVPHCARWANTPFVGRRRDGSHVVSQIDWDWSRASVGAVRLLIAFGRGTLLAESQQIFVPARHAARVRALHWRISWPRVVTSVDQLVTPTHGTS